MGAQIMDIKNLENKNEINMDIIENEKYQEQIMDIKNIENEIIEIKNKTKEQPNTQGYTCRELKQLTDGHAKCKIGESSSSVIPFFVYLSSGCSQSTAVGDFLRKILQQHGFDLFDYRYEFAFGRGKSYNPYWDKENETQQEVLIKMHDLAEDLGMSFILKSLWKKDFFEEILPYPNITAPFIQRENLLDRYICMARDCLTEDFRRSGSHTVDEDGNKTDLCFERRKSEVRQKIHIDID
eukprot:UN32781